MILPSDNDNYVKLGQTDKLVDGSDAPGGSPPSFAYIGSKAWEAAFHLDPGSYLGDGGLNVHAQVEPETQGRDGGCRRPSAGCRHHVPEPDADSETAEADRPRPHPPPTDRVADCLAERLPVPAAPL